LLYLNPFKAAGIAPQSMVADFLISQHENKDDELSPELEAVIKDAAAGVYLGDHLMLS
jgi:hypothetical protein